MIGEDEFECVHKVRQDKVDADQVLAQDPRGVHDDLSDDVTIAKLYKEI